MDKVDVEFPEDFLKRWLKSSNQQNLSDEELEDEFPKFLNGLKWSLMTSHILKEAEVQVSEEDIMERTRQMIKSEYQIPGEDEQTAMLVDQLANKMMEDKNHVNRVYEMIEENKAFEQLKTKFDIKEKEVSFDKFKEITKKN
jgi:trigger factor